VTAREKIASEDGSPSVAVRSDVRLVQDCISGDEEAWCELITRYKRLIYSIPIRYGLSVDEASDIFQSVCLDLLRDLKSLREVRALSAWLIHVTYHKCVRQRRRAQQQGFDIEVEEVAAPISKIPEVWLQELQRDHALRIALLSIGPRCRSLLHMLFFDATTRPYEDVAKSLKLSTGSIGPIRRRCLDEVRRCLQRSGFP
jgi:RNA polymerase sigma factor (sigma-70 family)